MLAAKSSATTPQPDGRRWSAKAGGGFIMSIARTTQKNRAISHHGSANNGKPITAMGKSIHSSAAILPSSRIPRISSARVQIGTAASVSAMHANACVSGENAAKENASATPGMLPNVPGPNGATSPNPHPVATNRLNFSTVVRFMSAHIIPYLSFHVSRRPLSLCFQTHH